MLCETAKGPELALLHTSQTLTLTLTLALALVLTLVLVLVLVLALVLALSFHPSLVLIRVLVLALVLALAPVSPIVYILAHSQTPSSLLQYHTHILPSGMILTTWVNQKEH